MVTIMEKHKRGELLNQKRTIGGAISDFPISSFFQMNSLPEVNWVQLLAKVANEELPLDKLKANTTGLIRTLRLRTAACYLLDVEDWRVVCQQYPALTTTDFLARHERAFTHPARAGPNKDKIPLAFRYVNMRVYVLGNNTHTY